MTSPGTIAADFLAACSLAGLTPVLDAFGRKVSITHRFTPGDAEGFQHLDCTATSILYLLPHDGSVFGLEGVGGHIALTKGVGTVKVLGVKPAVVKALGKVMK